MSDVELKSPAKPQGKAYALIFGVEKYEDPGFGSVTYAERDATEVANALLDLGYDAADVTVILNEKATKTTIEYEITELAHRATKDDTVLFFFAGHGYTYGGENFLVATDSRRGGIPKTFVSLRDMFEAFAGSHCAQVMFFLDCCHSGMKTTDEGRDVLEMMSHEELKAYFAEAEFRVVFSSCDKGEKSYPSHDYKHGYWTYHLLRALRGEETGVLDKDGRLRSTHLQDYLRSEVPKQVALKSTDRRSQNPKMYGDVSGSFIIADLAPLIAKRAAQRSLETIGLKHTTLRGTETGSVKGLEGFQKSKGHRVPTYHSRSSESWVPSLAAKELETEMERCFAAIRKSGRYSNKDLKYDPPSGGGSSIRTPDFEFSISYSQSSDDPGEYVAFRELLRLNTPDLLDEEWFNALFRGVFDEAIFSFSGNIDVSEFIDRAEDIESLDVDYDAKRSYATITLDGFDGEITVNQDSLTYEFYNAKTPKEMALQLQNAQTLLLSIPQMQKALPL